MEARTLLQVLVRQLRWSYDRFRRAYEQGAREVATMRGDPHIASATVAEPTFRRWTSGSIRTLPNEPAPTILEHIFRKPAGELLAAPREDAVPLPGASAINESEITMTARNAAEHAGEAASWALPDMTIDQIEDDVRRLARTYLATAPAESYRRGAELLQLARTMLDRTQRLRQRERLYLQAGATAAVMASASFDLGSLPSAVQLARTAALYGEVIDHGPLQAYAHGALAYLAYWDGRPAEAVRLVTIGQNFGGLGDTATTRLATIRARAHAHLADPESAEHAIASLDSPAMGRRDDLHDDIGGEFGMPPARAAMSNATTWILLRDGTGAQAAAERALELIEARPTAEQPALRGKAAVDLARARMLQRDLEGAAEAVEPVFALEADWRTMGVLERMAGLRHDLIRSSLADASAAKALGERVEEFTATSSASRSLASTGPLALGL
ncbi:hypothetical protein E1283_05425 [Streptomyces hainanensis]|uniref:Uncharacterized protein n=2 Tax=Streptomyces hainanensis TaxID=402648 RepID=A0A4R4TSS7_9ACTN|nr:hypothetical protein E1283_05425 [Streptomyces hainanensis]